MSESGQLRLTRSAPVTIRKEGVPRKRTGGPPPLAPLLRVRERLLPEAWIYPIPVSPSERTLSSAARAGFVPGFVFIQNHELSATKGGYEQRLTDRDVRDEFRACHAEINPVLATHAS